MALICGEPAAARSLFPLRVGCAAGVCVCVRVGAIKGGRAFFQTGAQRSPKSIEFVVLYF